MEIIFVSPTAVRLKTKTSLFSLFGRDPKEKNTLDALLTFHNHLSDPTVVSFCAPGEYEVKGIKFTGEGKEALLGFSARIENMSFFMTNSEHVADSKDFPEAEIALIQANALFDMKQIASIGAHLIVLFGESALAVAQELQKEIQPVTKVAISKEKLPEDTQIVVLG